MRVLRTVLITATVALGATGLRAQDADTAKILESCRAIADSATRLRCFENATSNLAGPKRPPVAAAPPTVSTSMGGWRLVRTPNPTGGKDAVSIMHTPDLLRSDPDLAGLMIRCGDAGNEVVMVLISPFPPRAHPQVAIGEPGAGTRFEAKVSPPGVFILLPNEAIALASGPWQSLAELPVEIIADGTAIRGVFPLQGLSAALKTLTASCPGP
jgi:hypothetical protein